MTKSVISGVRIQRSFAELKIFAVFSHTPRSPILLMHQHQYPTATRQNKCWAAPLPRSQEKRTTHFSRNWFFFGTPDPPCVYATHAQTHRGYSAAVAHSHRDVGFLARLWVGEGRGYPCPRGCTRACRNTKFREGSNRIPSPALVDGIAAKSLSTNRNRGGANGKQLPAMPVSR